MEDRPDLTETLHAATRGDPRASADLLPLVYDELRLLARARLAKVPPGNTLQPTALVHEAYLRLVKNPDQEWNGKRHFFGAAANAMRQILVDQVRRKKAVKHGGDRVRLDVGEVEIVFDPPTLDVVAVHHALDRLEKKNPRHAEMVLLRMFAGLDRQETAQCMGISDRTVDRDWRYVMAWLHRELSEAPDDHGG